MPRAVVFDEFGGPEVLRIVDEPTVAPGPGEVRIRIEAFAVNPLDAMMRAGNSPRKVELPHARIGVEGTGVVDAIGAEVSDFGVGDPVILAAIPDAWIHGTYAEFTTVPASWVIPRPPGLGVVQAAAIWVAYSTAYGALVERAAIRPADRVLISGASSAVGRAAMQIATMLGAEPIAVTRTAARRQELLDAGAVEVIATDSEDVPDAVRRHTGGVGVDVVLDLVRGPGQQQLAAATRWGGTLVAAGFLDPRPTPLPEGTPLRIFIYASFQDTLDPVVVHRMSAFLAAGVRLSALAPAIDDVLPFGDVVEAHRRLAAGDHAGRKIVVTVD